MGSLVKSYKVDDVYVLEVHGELDSEGASKLESAFEDAFTLGQKNIVVDLKDTSYIGSSGLRVLISALKEVKPKGGDVRLCNIQSEVYKVISMVGYTKLFKIYKTEDEAIKSFGNA